MHHEKYKRLFVFWLPFVITMSVLSWLYFNNVQSWGLGEALDPDSEQAVAESAPFSVTTPANLHNLTDFNVVIRTPTGRCERLENVGGTLFRLGFDGNKDVCLDPWFLPAFNTCLLYSFGVGFDITFEKAMVQKWGCRVFMHDHTVSPNKHQHSERITFKQWGVANESYVDLDGNKFVTYRDALEANGHIDSQVHYLKIDIEEDEYKILPGMIASGLLNNVWQLHMEVHSFRRQDTIKWLRDMQESYAILRQLEDIGFRRVSTLVLQINPLYSNMTAGPLGCCNDVLWINTNRLPGRGHPRRV